MDTERLSERLEIIKFLRNSEKTVAPGMQPSELISRKDVDWLINRVEELINRVEELEQVIGELEQQNKRYRKYLELIRKTGIQGRIISTGEIILSDEAELANEALEGRE